jgi:CubicO group peptidase (beta-lactamase class C family)
MFKILLFTLLSGSIYAQLSVDVQTLLDQVSSLSGYSFSVGYVDGNTDSSYGWGSGPITPPNFPAANPPTGTVGFSDTMLLGSGTKPYTAAALHRLVDQNKLKLTDLAHLYLDPVLDRMRPGTTFASLFGKEALTVQVRDLIHMSSGIADFDIPTYDNLVLKSTGTVTIMDTLDVVAKFQEPNGCTTYNCTWVCPNGPGTCVSYSSTSFILAGLVLLHFAPEKANTWETYDQKAGLGLADSKTANRTFFPRTGSMQDILTSSGSSLQYGQAEILKQDASILGWTCGNGISSGLDAALFVYDLLSPAFQNDQNDDNENEKSNQRRQGAPIVSKKGLKDMLNFTTLNTGWAKNEVDYGGGIMVQNVNLKYGMPPYDKKPPPHNVPTTYFGHGGDTYGFMSDSGYYPLLNASVSVIVNQDSDYVYPSYVVTCNVVKLIMIEKKMDVSEVKCIDAHPSTFECQTMYGEKVCAPSYRSRTSLKDCQATCK